MTFETRRAYSEVCAVLECMPDEYVKKIPKKIIHLFQTEKLENYEVNINKLNPLDKKCLSQKAMAIIAMLNYQCWFPNQKVKEELYKQYLSNNKKYEDKIKEKYSIDNIFKNKKVEKTVKIGKIEVQEIQDLIEYKEKTFIQKIFDKIKSFLKIK